MDIVELFSATKEIPKRCTLYMTMATIIGRKREKKEEKNFYKKFSVQYI